LLKPSHQLQQPPPLLLLLLLVAVWVLWPHQQYHLRILL
jgi:hypothetical protein